MIKSPHILQKRFTASERAKRNAITIVAIGASAGGLEAVSVLLSHLSSDTGMSFFYLQHLSPNHPSNLSVLLSRATKMKVREVTQNMKIERNTIYVCTPNKEMKINGAVIKLKPRNNKQMPYLPIDDFFTSTAQYCKENMIGIILSGNAADGSQGLKAVQDAGGVTFAQDHSAKYGSMPQSVINNGAADLILSPKEIALELNKIAKSRPFHKIRLAPSKKEENSSGLKIILDSLANKTGIDFDQYKLTTIKRRLNYRMLHCGASTISDYLKILDKSEDEAGNLAKDMLIHVTGFFRDAEAFRYLKAVHFPKLLKAKKSGEALRIWIPGCSTGEEVYSMAMLISELLDKTQRRITAQIFASDVSEHALFDARAGQYPESVTKQISKERLKRFFTKSAKNYRIKKEIREMCVFAKHNILQDPPFSKMDFISCCNVLIYFEATAQKKAIATLNFSLNEGGSLMLGKSETVGRSSQYFSQISDKYKIYQRRRVTGIRRIPELIPKVSGDRNPVKPVNLVLPKKPISENKELDQVIDNALLSHYMPACVVVNKDLDILKFRGTTSTFLSHRTGNASLNIIRMVRPDIAIELRTAIQKALKTNLTVKKPEIEIKIDDTFRQASLEVRPLVTEWNEQLLLLVFTLKEQSNGAVKGAKPTRDHFSQERRLRMLSEKLDSTREEMQSVIESQEHAYEKLQSANEEIVSSSEEFQTLNEELESSKEEIEATNEELITTNHELQMRNDLLTESYSYSEAIIATIHEPMVVLDSNFLVKTANKAFYSKCRFSKDKTEGVSFFELGNNQWDIPKLRNSLNDILTKNIEFKNLEITHTFPGVGEKTMLLNAHRIIQKAHREKLVLLAIEDITERTRNYLNEKENFHRDIRLHKSDKLELEKAVGRRTQQLEKKNIELENANKDLKSFTYVSSHDLQEPLRKIRNFASVLLKEESERLSQDGKKYLKRTYETAMRMQALIEDLLTYSRTKDAERKFDKVSLSKLVEDIVKEFEDSLLDKKITVKTTGLGHANIIEFQFRQLFQNLISNSLKFVKPGKPGKIRIKSNFVYMNRTDNGPKAQKIKYDHIIYSDTGIGFDPKYNELVFEVFQRLHGAEKYQGTGMGLAICKRIVENHNGTILATGKMNKGVRFDIYIPRGAKFREREVTGNSFQKLSQQSDKKQNE